MIRSCNLCTQRKEAGELQVHGQPGLHSDSQNLVREMEGRREEGEESNGKEEREVGERDMVTVRPR